MALELASCCICGHIHPPDAECVIGVLPGTDISPEPPDDVVIAVKPKAKAKKVKHNWTDDLSHPEHNAALSGAVDKLADDSFDISGGRKGVLAFSIVGPVKKIAELNESLMSWIETVIDNSTKDPVTAYTSSNCGDQIMINGHRVG